MEVNYVKLGEHCSKIGSGATPKGGSSVYVDSGVSLIRSQNVYNLQFSYSGLAHICDSAANKLKGVTVYKDDVLLNITGDSVARTCIVPENVLPARVNQHVAIIRPKKDIDSRYLNYYLASPSMQGYLLSIASTGASRNAITKAMIEKLIIPIPDFPTQRRIASILSSYDNLIEANSRRIKILEQMAENLYKEWFVRFRFPNYQNTPIENGIPKGWKVETIDQFCRVFTGKKDVNQTVEDGKYPFFSCSAQDFRSNDYIYEGKAILVAGNGNTGKSKFYDGKFDLYQRTYAIVCESDLIYYLFMRFKTDFEVIYAGGSRGTAIPYIVMKNITKYKFLYNKELIDKFVSIIKPIFSQINTLQLQSANLTRQRDLLLPRLMSGQLTPLTNQ